jgi:hypothetical protein
MEHGHYEEQYMRSFIAGLQTCYKDEGSYEYRHNTEDNVWFIRVSPLSFFESQKFRTGLIKQNTLSYKDLEGAFIFFVPEGFSPNSKWTPCDMIIRF